MPISLLINQYVIIKNSDGEIIDKGRWTESGFAKLKYKNIENNMFGKISPRNIEQQMAFDLLQNKNITGALLIGSMGSGKTMLSLCYALDQVTSNRSKYDRIVFLRNSIPVKNTVDLGALPGTLEEKIRPYAMSLADIIGSITELDRLIQEEVIVLDHLGFIRGRSYKRSLIILSEAQNITREMAALLIARVGEDSRLIVEGDISQCDKDVFEKQSGIMAMVDALKGDPEFGMVTLKKNERSRFASLSDRLL